VQPVPAPAWRLRPGPAPWLALAVIVLVAGIALAVASSGDSGPTVASAKSSLELIGGKPLQQASCADWVAGSPDERAAVIAALKRDVGGGTPYGPGTTLSSAAAYSLFQRSCAAAYAQGFLLYELYTRASAFQYTPQHFQ
jgi:hypothetical protein